MRKISLLCTGLVCLSLISCLEVMFTKRLTGRAATELAGEYLFSYGDPDNPEKTAFVEFQHISGSHFLLIDRSRETPDFSFELDIIAKGNDYFIQRPDSIRPELWHISSFRIIGDSAYNFLEAMAGEQDTELQLAEQFRAFQLQVEEDDSTYIVDNRKRETIKAFRALNQQAVTERNGVLLQRITAAPTTDIDNDQALEKPPLTVGPNPFQSQLHITLSIPNKSKVKILDMQGRTLQGQQFEGGQLAWDLSVLPAGMYLLHWQDLETGQHRTYRLVKE